MALRDRISAVLSESKWMSASDVWLALGEDDLARGSVQQALREMGELGDVETDRSKKKHLYRMVNNHPEHGITPARPVSEITTMEEIHGEPPATNGAELAARLHSIFEEIERLTREKLEILRRLHSE